MSILQSNSIGTNLITQNESSANGFRERNFLVQSCSLCQGEIMLDVGDIIYGEKWYHGECWELIEKKVLLS